ncbi:MAG: metallophosphoesterase [Omnitrophica bacterium RIFCSPLOWO2_12_FULL_44_17]|uniref:Metallophosphoesterase n=1 Tax=Candidatus Danuiimicrobium aquiferis TaxID=1801832 RepID=A0A1G1L1D0_9BACT|nr:MAG: metallophosphoesterase [Omnitrophica bacterium RIFCSPHIGHO2_02_FULL_45_28]OGW88521.1 MAG: metallophosphoesterase [Omnitrophica bacterium RIFCSPHIGHO2_12_FULL_44_12]OGW98946.1 MAG: metallophosphoesterase [Omnitrophica bacterium RIFCSPLOWO2_12_FULL_44_17]OGX02037.1 MAG: metallophosphoesterase [Omnitrophica bacterium RIFCSPLOWO2_02_FULL_44_11]
MKILAIGDVVGKPGREACRKIIPKLREKFDLDFVVANGENLAGGSGVTKDTVQELLNAGVDVVTTGDHIFKKKETKEVLEAHMDVLLRPLNYPQGVPGQGFTVITTNKGINIAVVNLMGRVFMQAVDCPFKAIDAVLNGIKKRANVVLVDIHAEATSEKVAMSWYLDGRVSAVFGTHTHIQTADETVLPKGTAFISDLGMTGPYKSVLGRKIDQVIEKFLTQMPVRMEVAEEDVRLSGVLIEIDSESGKANTIERVQEKM